jgi:rfaE bifunctional protein nucleotidyltransferase chain/domain
MSLEVLLANRAGRKIVFTNGVFDILHAGHVQYLQAARDLGDALVVALNSDESVRQLKGPTRPVNPLADRMAVLAALRCVDAVTSFGEATAEKILERIQPDIFVKGGDYTVETLPGREAQIVLGYGGDVVIMPLLEGRSTTRILRELGSE